FYGEIWWSGNQPYLTMKRGFFYPTLEALWNPRHSQGFSKTIIKMHLSMTLNVTLKTSFMKSKMEKLHLNMIIYQGRNARNVVGLCSRLRTNTGRCFAAKTVLVITRKIFIK